MHHVTILKYNHQWEAYMIRAMNKDPNYIPRFMINQDPGNTAAPQTIGMSIPAVVSLFFKLIPLIFLKFKITLFQYH